MRKKIFLLALIPVLLLTIVTIGSASYSTVVSVYPQKSSVKVGQTFNVDINIEDVSGLQGFDFCLKYPSTILEVSEVEEGPFLASFGPTFVAKLEIEEDYQMYRGRVWLAVVIYGDGFANGSGTLATITFNATVPGQGELDLFSDPPFKSYQIKLVTCGPEPIPHEVVDGYVVVSSNPDDPPPDPPDPPNPHDPDLNDDGKIDIRDVTIVARAYGKSKGEAGYNPEVDLDQNGVIDIRDVTIVAASFGQVF